VDIKEFYINEKWIVDGQDEPKIFTQKYVNDYVQEFKEKRSYANEAYSGASLLIDEAAEFINVTGKTVLVIGSQSPWLEAVLISRNVHKVITLEYGFFNSEHPSLEIIRPSVFLQRYKDGTLEKFDAVFTYSSVEHSGLGRYGDSLNPWGDIISVAQSWCVSKPEAHLAIGVPTFINGRDRVEFNAHRVYGPNTYPYLTTNWRFVWPLEEKKRTASDGHYLYQPVFVFSRLSA